MTQGGADWELPLPAEQLIPHRPPMRLVDALLEFREKSGVVAATVTAEGPLTTRDGRLEAVGLIEILAQAYAAVQGYDDLRQGRPVQMGFLVGIRSIRIEGEARVGDRLLVKLRPLAEMEGFALAEGEIRRGDSLLASGTLKLWIPPVVDTMGEGQ